MDVCAVTRIRCLAQANIDADYSSYELYTEPLRKGALKFDRGSGFGPRQLRVVIDRNRKVIKTVEI